jgi:hypothetical protein
MRRGALAPDITRTPAVVSQTIFHEPLQASAALRTSPRSSVDAPSGSRVSHGLQSVGLVGQVHLKSGYVPLAPGPLPAVAPLHGPGAVGVLGP